MKEKEKTEIDSRIIKIAQKLRKLREAKGVSYEEFAFNNGISRISYYRIEKGTNFTINSLLKVLDIHKISLNEFFDGLE